MMNFKWFLPPILTLLVEVSGCSGGNSASTDAGSGAAVPLNAASTSPASGASGVAVDSTVQVTFSKAVNASTLTTSSFTLSALGGTGVSGTVSYDASSNTATFAPSAPLSINASYTATVSTDVRSADGVPLSANDSWSFTTDGNASTAATVDFGSAGQVIRGFGGSVAFLGPLTNQQATALFDPSSGLGLSVLRVRIDPSGSASSNWVTNTWQASLANAQLALEANPNAIVFASPWTPPAAWKTSSASQPYYSGSPPCRVDGLCGGYLDPSHYADYAGYLEAFVQYFQANGVNLYGISMQNEPDFSGQSYESCSWTPAQMDTWVANNASTLTARLIMPETYRFDPAQAAPTLDAPNAASKVSIVGGHLYGTQPSYYAQAKDLGKDVWMTEHYIVPATGKGTEPTMTDALRAAKEIHDSMVTGQYNAYVWWWIWNSPSSNVTVGLINSDTTNPVPTYYGSALGQYSKFIQPGYYRYSATDSPQTNIYVSAYAGGGHRVIVAINNGSSTVSQSFRFQNATVTSMTPWQTTASGGLQQKAALAVNGGLLTVSLPAQSITTYVE